MKRVALALLLVFAIVPLEAAQAGGGGGGFCVSEPVTDRRGDSVDMKDYCFFPNVLRVDAGDAVRFENFDTDAHTVTGVGLWGSGHKEYGTGDKATFTFKDEGTFLYSCLLHPGMVGAVIVGDGKGKNFAGASVVKGSDDPSAAKPAPGDAAAASSPESESNNSGYVLAGLVALGVVVALVLVLARARRSRVAPTTMP
jgi:plastocyanin